jgi:hypothetical protein
MGEVEGIVGALWEGNLEFNSMDEKSPGSFFEGETGV